MSEPTAETRPCECGKPWSDHTQINPTRVVCAASGCDNWRPTPAPPATTGPGWVKRPLPWSEYPIGTYARSSNGMSWMKTAHGWLASGGDTFPTPAADACEVRLPAVPDSAAPSSPPSGEIGAPDLDAKTFSVNEVNQMFAFAFNRLNDQALTSRATLDASIAALQERAETAERALRDLNDRIAAAFA